MKFKPLINKVTKFPFCLIVIAVLVFAAVFVWFGKDSSNQANAAIMADVVFKGEYSIAQGDWHPVVDGEHIPATQGKIYLRGFFQLLNPDNGEPLCPLTNGSVYLYLNHIGCKIYMPDGTSFEFENESSDHGEDACAVTYEAFVIPESEDNTGELLIILQNPHVYGNERAVDDFLENLSIASGLSYENEMLEKGVAERNIGLVIVISSLIILGIAAFSTVIKINSSKEMWLIGLMSLFAGGYFLFDAFAVGLWNDSNIMNTRILVLSIMFYTQFSMMLIICILKGRKKLVAAVASSLLMLAVVVCISISFFTDIKFFDTLIYWTVSGITVSLVFIFCLILSFKGASIIEKFLYSVSIITLISLPVDAVATKLALWEGGLVSKHVFLAVFMMALVIVLRIIPSNINAAIKANRLESEQRALKLELQESRISIMLSQMQPHFIYNTLNTIYHLCEINPDAARSTISSFSEYLRNNIDNLGHSDMISFEKELSFVKTYLDIEKVRFDDELDIVFDIKAMNFKLPVLSIQPIVENAVKHGTSKKEGGGSLFISTDEKDSCYEIIIADTGVGFDASAAPNDGHKHVGISSVRQRLENLCGGTLTIDSTLGKGTKVTIKIPKKEMSS